LYEKKVQMNAADQIYGNSLYFSLLWAEFSVIKILEVHPNGGSLVGVKSSLGC